MKTVVVCLDLEGTIFRSEALAEAHMSHILSLLSRKMQITSEEAKELLKLKRESLATKLKYTPPLTTLVEMFGITKQEFYDEINKVDPRMYLRPDVKLQRTFEVLKRKGLKLALLTNVDYKYTTRILEALNINLDFFDYIITGSDVTRVKPNIEPFCLLLKGLNVSPQQVLMVGDRIEIDLATAKKLGMKTALISQYFDAYKNELVDFLLQEIYDLVNVL